MMLLASGEFILPRHINWCLYLMPFQQLMENVDKLASVLLFYYVYINEQLSDIHKAL